jgi:deazaflavin-dependent oxidoreductase (nitroreductase family)
MSRDPGLKQRVVTAFQRHVANPVLRRVPFHTVLETTGRVSGLPRRTPIGGRRTGDTFWLVSEYGEKSQYVRNIKADPSVRLRHHGRWHHGTAHLLPADDPLTRLSTLPTLNSTAVRALGTNLLTIRIDLHD